MQMQIAVHASCSWLHCVVLLCLQGPLFPEVAETPPGSVHGCLHAMPESSLLHFPQEPRLGFSGCPMPIGCTNGEALGPMGPQNATWIPLGAFLGPHGGRVLGPWATRVAHGTLWKELPARGVDGYTLRETAGLCISSSRDTYRSFLFSSTPDIPPIS